ncbi:CLUMA_CG013195, isoform A [Clunio marinus]|uniref:CLUMA_CG013195, isoform A n=1 Tax=Clunio marinus TaxID=568069 RepID=A0A1J1IK21_9DIPT|nr:CLUMA_CG013195, isoform A [Clunio marinus]
MFLLIGISALFCAQVHVALGSQSNYNNFNKQQYQNIQSQAFGHQPHHHQPQQQQHNYNKPQTSFQSNRNFIPITSYKNEVSHDGSYQYSYSTGNGIQADESGYLKNRGSQNQAQVAQGSYSYTAPNGQLIQVRYIADELGFRAEGNHLPTPPPVPEAIAKSLQLIARTQPAPASHHSQPWSNRNQYDGQHFGK